MATLRVYHADVTAQPTLRVYNASMTGTVATNPTLRIYNADYVGAVGAVVNPLSPQTVEPHSTVTLTATLATGSGTPDSYQWRVLSGPSVTFSGVGATVTFLSPDAMPPGTSVTVGVSAIIAGNASNEQTVVITVLPQTCWSRVPGGQWVGSPTVALA